VNSPVFNALIPVVFLIGLGYLAGRRGWVGGAAVRDLSNLVFLVLMPALLFRSMAGIHLEQLELKPIALYFLSALLLFAIVLLVQGLNKRGTVVALAAIFSNTVMIGLPLVRLAYGEAGFVPMVTLVSLHALVLLTVVTVVLELISLRESGADAPAGAAGGIKGIVRTVLMAMRNTIIHPVPLPIIAGLLFAQTGLAIPQVLEQPLQLLGAAFSPVALILVGVTLALTSVGPHVKVAFQLSLVKNVVHPLLMLGIGWLFGLRGLPLVVMVIAASMPIGANVFLFSQRYKVAETLVTASVAVSTALALVTVTIAMALAGLIPH
jgi:hypothetical protein